MNMIVKTSEIRVKYVHDLEEGNIETMYRIVYTVYAHDLTISVCASILMDFFPIKVMCYK